MKSIVKKTVFNATASFRVLACLVCFSFVNVHAQTNRSYVSHSFHDNTLIIKSDNGIIWVQPYTDKIVKVTLLNPGLSHPDASDSVILKPERAHVTLEDKGSLLELSTDAVTVRVHKSPINVEFCRRQESLATNTGFFAKPSGKEIKFSLTPDECIYGTGFRSIPINRRGYKLDLYNKTQYAYKTNATNLNYSVPLAISSRRYMILFDNPEKGFMDIGKSSNDEMTFGAIGGELAYYFISDDSYEGLERSYTRLTGRQPMPPRWALGYLQSRMSYASEAETRKIVDETLKDNFPLDAIIIDLDWFGKFTGDMPSTNLMGNLAWDPDNWKNPGQMIKDFADKGVKTVLVTEPYVVQESSNFDYVYKNGLAATDSAGKPFLIKDFYFGPGLLLDIFKPAAREWFWKQYKKQIKIGVAGWWGDLGEPERHPSEIHHVKGDADAVHNIYGHYWDKMLFDDYKREYPAVRLFNLNRSGFAGSQRYAVFPWTGDVSRTWEGLQAQLPSLLSMSMCGLGYIHSDAGGFTPDSKDEELYTRWLEFAVFCPIFRVHGDRKVPPEPIFHSDATKDVVRDFIKLRYRMLPYNYTLAWLNSSQGTPLMRPLYYSDPENALVGNYSDEYYWGDEFLVAPVLYKGQEKKDVYLPEGTWFDFWNDNKHAGGRTINEKLAMDKIPVYVKAGSFVPMIDPITNTAGYSSANLTVHYYFDEGAKSSSYTMYEDDGKINGDLEKGMNELLNFKAEASNGGIAFTLSKSGGKYERMPLERNLEFVIHNVPKAPTSTSADGKNLVSQWDKDLKQLRFILKWKMEPSKIDIKLLPSDHDESRRL
jgi:oligosaccharide 4-alpha-D-glucosyltransferase